MRDASAIANRRRERRADYGKIARVSKLPSLAHLVGSPHWTHVPSGLGAKNRRGRAGGKAGNKQEKKESAKRRLAEARVVGNAGKPLGEMGNGKEIVT
jgi:hypothetical protein